MPLSTFNSETPWLKIWLFAFGISILFLVFLEIFWRGYGHAPSVNDDKDLWAYTRSQIYPKEKKPVVFIGQSRVQTDISLETIKTILPKHLILQLGITGLEPISVLRDLAEDRNFKGVVLCSITEMGFTSAMREEQVPYVSHYHNQFTLSRKIGRRLTTLLQEDITLLNTYLSPKQILTQHKGIPKPSYRITYRDRSITTDYTKTKVHIKLKAFGKKFMGKIPSQDEWLKEAMEVERMVKKIKERGGKVVFIVLPIGPLFYKITENAYPKKRYWDRFSKRTSAITLHFKDTPALQGFTLPDESHLDYRDTPRFTYLLVKELIALQALP